MADIEFVCPECGETLEASEDMIGESVECPGCGERIVVTDPEDAGDDVVPTDGGCPECGSDMPDEAMVCVACGFHRELGRRIPTDLL